MRRSSGVGGLLVVVLLATFGAAHAAEPPVGLGTATSFAVLGGSTVTNTGPSVVSGDVGVSPGTAVTGFPPGEVRDGTIHANDAVAAQAQADVTTAYNDAAGRPATPVSDDLGGQTLSPGAYRSDAGMGLTGTVTLDGQGDASAVFIFQAGSTLITGSGSTVALVRGAQPCNVFWQVGSSATLATDSTFAGTVMALSSVTVQTGATVQGRVFARNAAVTLDTNTITRPTCESASTPTTQPGSSDGGGGGDGSGSGPGSGGGANGGSGGGANGGGGIGGGTGNGTGNGGGGSTTTATTGPGANLIPPVVVERQPPATVPSTGARPGDGDGAAIPKTGVAVAPAFTLGAALLVLGALSIWRAHGAST